MYPPTPSTNAEHNALVFEKCKKQRRPRPPKKNQRQLDQCLDTCPPALDVHYAKPTWPKPPKMSGQACVDNWEFWGGREGVGMCEREGGRGGQIGRAHV